MAKLSLCMVVKDSEVLNAISNIASTKNHLYKYVDEIIFATGLPEDKIKEYKIQFPKVMMCHYKWKDDFADARNFSFSKATGDYIFWIDGDDIVRNPENLPKIIEKMEKEGIDWCHLEYLYERDEYGNIIMRQWKPRITRKGTGIWKMPIHEVYEPTTEVNQVIMDDVVIDHQVKDSAKHRLESAERNLRILLKHYQDNAENPDPRTLYYIGNTFMGLEKFEEAIPFYQTHIVKCGWPEEKYFSLHYLAFCLAWTSRLDEAIGVALEATKIFPHWSLAYFDLGAFYSMKEDYLRTIEWTLTGLTKKKPDSKAYFSSDTDYTLYPLARLAEAYLFTEEYDRAYDIANKLHMQFNIPLTKELLDKAKEILETEDFVESFLTVAKKIGDTDRIKGAKLFDALPGSLDEDIRIQNQRLNLVPPKNWEAKSIAIYCGKGMAGDWGPPSIYTGVGGSETMVILLSQELTKLGYKITVYNQCGDFRGTYKGVEYLPYYHFNQRDNFNILIAWRTPGLFNFDLKAKQKIIWMHDLSYPQMWNKKIIDQVDKVILLSQFHRSAAPEVPDEKVFISNNGINTEDFREIPEKKPNSLFYGSSYDRGALTLIRDIMPLVHKEIPDATLEVCYGWDVLDKTINERPGIYPGLEQLRAELTPLLEQPWITHHGRVGHKQLAKIMGSCVALPYSSEFGETNMRTSQEAQAAGCYVITTSQAGGAPEWIRFGEIVEGDSIYTDKVLQQKFADRVINFLKEPKKLTKEEHDKILEEFSVSETARHWDKELLHGKA